MKVAKLIELLSKVPPQVEVLAWDFDNDTWEPVSAVTWTDDGDEIILETEPR